MGNTTASDIIRFFESSFVDKHVISESLEMVWLEKAIGRYSIELDPLNFDKELLEFDTELDSYIMDTLSVFMKEYYQERQVSLANKRISIVGKDISIDGSNGAKTAEKSHLEYVGEKAREMVGNQLPNAGMVSFNA